MTMWGRGYQTDTGYAVGWQAHFAPGKLEVVCALNGVVWNAPREGALIELGCGRGFTTNLLAAVNPGWRVHGIDFAPAQIAEARELAAEAGIPNVHFQEADIAALSEAELGALPEADIIALHGVWTWVSDEVRAGILRVIRRCLKPGGLVYIGYNALPGFARDFAMQRLVRAAAEQARGSPIERLGPALALLRGFAQAKPAHLMPSPLLERFTKTDDPVNPAYLAHEFLTEHWRPAYFADVAAAMEEARCEFVGSLSLWENVPDLCFSPEVRPVYDSFASVADRELVKDICLTRPFRRDVFVRGLRRTDPTAALDRLAVVSALPASKNAAKVHVQHGLAELPEAMSKAILERLAAGPITLGELRRTPQGGPNPAELAVLLFGFDGVLPWRGIPEGHHAAGFNRAAGARYGTLGTAPLALAAPAAGTGLSCGAGEIALVAELQRRGAREPDPAELAAVLLANLGEAERAEGAASIAVTLADRGPIWRALGIL